MTGNAPEVLLYHAPPSFYSQIARIVLAEKGVSHEQRVLLPGPPQFETYAPWYMRLNPGGTVPTLLIGGAPIDDSRKILYAVDARFEGPALIPSDERVRAEMEQWIDRAYALPERILAYGSDSFKRLGAKVNDRRRRALIRARDRNPDLREVYEAKIADIDEFSAETHDPAHVKVVEQDFHTALDTLDRHLSARAFVCGDAYTLADCVWTVTVARQHMLHYDPFPQRPALAAWYERMKARPSFAGAQIWESFDVLAMLRVMVGKYKRPLVAAALVVLSLGAGLIYALGP